MNLRARENHLQYILRKCNEAIVQTKHERTVLQALLNQAVADNAITWVVAIKQKLKDHRIKLNRLTARRHILRRKLDIATQCSLQASSNGNAGKSRPM